MLFPLVESSVIPRPALGPVGVPTYGRQYDVVARLSRIGTPNPRSLDFNLRTSDMRLALVGMSPANLSMPVPTSFPDPVANITRLCVTAGAFGRYLRDANACVQFVCVSPASQIWGGPVASAPMLCEIRGREHAQSQVTRNLHRGRVVV
ncbi:hypothetical protein CSOJ01_08492 [Colletotrichum sojae]|uniref:Uncharacterized protein n=1 Tax=Colletotrichum sojae TaxID=2175907 RepID=A0A8H6MSU1_9PEZI|nr:hypothetical protein CSOJ01_08492 [Colletotrichum sojae]